MTRIPQTAHSLPKMHRPCKTRGRKDADPQARRPRFCTAKWRSAGHTECKCDLEAIRNWISTKRNAETEMGSAISTDSNGDQPLRYVDGELADVASAYVHVPFCQHKCGYCNFTVVANRQDLVPTYLEALEWELASTLAIPTVMQTIFLGGGTPSFLAVDELDQLLKLIAKWLPHQSTTEFSCEVNPIDCRPEKLQVLRDGGVNRISIGGQSFSNRKLTLLERDHTGEQLTDAIANCLRVFNNVSVDLIFAAPGETLEEWQQDLTGLLESGATHASTYGLTIEKGSNFFGRMLRDDIREVSSVLQREMYELALDRFGMAGWEHYEVSSFASEIPCEAVGLSREVGSGHALDSKANQSAERHSTFRCRHNEAYWLGELWHAFGPGAASFLRNDASEVFELPLVRQVNHRSTTAYLKKCLRRESPIAERDALSWEDYLRERLVFGLRRLQGVQLEDLSRLFAQRVEPFFEPYLDRYIDEGWLQRNSVTGNLQLTHAGLMISDSLWPDLLAPGA